MKIFLSAVSAQFKGCRDELASDLRAIGCEVKVQEEFQQHGGALLEKLETYLAGCDRVISLVDDAYGYEPLEPARLDGWRQPANDLLVYFASSQYLAQFPLARRPRSSSQPNA